MPIEIKAYKCVYKCRKTSTKFGTMARHEEKCLCNPALKTCKTCSNDEFDRETYENYCHAEVDKGDKKLMHYCEKWEAKERRHGSQLVVGLPLDSSKDKGGVHCDAINDGQCDLCEIWGKCVQWKE